MKTPPLTWEQIQKEGDALELVPACMPPEGQPMAVNITQTANLYTVQLLDGIGRVLVSRKSESRMACRHWAQYMARKLGRRILIK